MNGRCICQQGFAFNSAQVCTPCASLRNGFIINDVCAVCPGNLVYNGNACACPAGKTRQGSLCVSQCQNDELLDSEGNCYTCGNNQIISSGRCVCSPGHTRNSCGMCILSCSQNQFSFQGACATCPLNTIFNAAINGCACPNGFYMDHFGVCQRLVLRQLSCPDGQYFDSNIGCTPCVAPCRTCRSATQCIACATAGFSANSQGVCGAVCGDGIVVGTEGCDTGNATSAGCVNCRVQAGFVCSGQPSVCRSTAPTPAPARPATNSTPAPARPANNSAPAGEPALSQVGATNINSNNVFISLRTNPTFTFGSPTEMQGFMRA